MEPIDATDLDADLTNVCATAVTAAGDRDVLLGGDGELQPGVPRLAGQPHLRMWAHVRTPQG